MAGNLSSMVWGLLGYFPTGRQAARQGIIIAGCTGEKKKKPTRRLDSAAVSAYTGRQGGCRCTRRWRWTSAGSSRPTRASGSLSTKSLASGTARPCVSRRSSLPGAINYREFCERDAALWAGKPVEELGSNRLPPPLPGGDRRALRDGPASASQDRPHLHGADAVDRPYRGRFRGGLRRREPADYRGRRLYRRGRGPRPPRRQGRRADPVRAAGRGRPRRRHRRGRRQLGYPDVSGGGVRGGVRACFRSAYTNPGTSISTKAFRRSTGLLTGIYQRRLTVNLVS